jgi:hypothetical protein
MTFKEKVYHSYLAIIESKIKVLQKSLTDLQDSAGNETKRTAGDKHETALAMLQIEQENINRQLNEAVQQKMLLSQIDPSLQTIQVCKGSLVTTSKGIFYISSALGKTITENTTVIALSPESPLGNRMMHLKQGDCFSFHQTAYIIEKIH